MTAATARRAPELRVVVEVDAGLPLLAAAAELARERLRSELAWLLERLGLEGRPAPAVSLVDSRRALRVRVHGAAQPYDPRLARQIWLAAVPQPLAAAALRFEQGPGDPAPDRWLREAVEEVTDPRTLEAFACRLVVEVLARRAACLVCDEQVAEYASAEDAVVGPDAAVLGEVLRTLLAFAISAADRRAVLRAVHERGARTAADVAESLIARLRPSRVELHLNPRTLADLLEAPSRSTSLLVYRATREETHAAFEAAEDFVYLDIGLRLPDLYWVPAEQMAEETVAVRVNDLLGAPLPLPPPGKLLVNAPPATISATQAEPALGMAGPSALIDARDAETLSLQGYATLDRHAFIQQFLVSEVLRNAPRLLCIRDVEFELHHIAAPQLVEDLLERMSIEELTRVLRELLDGGLPTRDLAGVLERLLAFDTIDADADADAIFDDRLALPGAMPSTPRARARALSRHVREGMAGFIGSRFSFGADTLVAYLLDDDFDRRALEVASDEREHDVDRPEDEALVDALRDAVWHELSFLPTAATRPVLLTSRRARTAVRRVLAPELPDLRVVRYSEIPPELNVMPIARISAPALDSAAAAAPLAERDSV